jgi:hypothetical protein
MVRRLGAVAVIPVQEEAGFGLPAVMQVTFVAHVLSGGASDKIRNRRHPRVPEPLTPPVTDRGSAPHAAVQSDR